MILNHYIAMKVNRNSEHFISDKEKDTSGLIFSLGKGPNEKKRKRVGY